MNHRLLANVHVTLGQPKLRRDDAAAIEALLRADDKIYNLVIEDHQVVFYIWDEEKIDYSVLEKIKKLLQDKGYVDFVITADEYAKTGQKYYYANNDSSLRKG